MRGFLSEDFRPVGAFSKSRAEIRSMDSWMSARKLPSEIREAERGYRLRLSQLVTAPGFKERRGSVQVGSFPWRKIGGRTPVVVTGEIGATLRAHTGVLTRKRGC